MSRLDAKWLGVPDLPRRRPEKDVLGGTGWSDLALLRKLGDSGDTEGVVVRF